MSDRTMTREEAISHIWELSAQVSGEFCTSSEEQADLKQGTRAALAALGVIDAYDHACPSCGYIHPNMNDREAVDRLERNPHTMEKLEKARANDWIEIEDVSIS